MVDAATGDVLLESLVNPQIPVTEDALDVHGISDAMVAVAPTWDQVLSEVLRVTAGRKILAYNAAASCSSARPDTGAEFTSCETSSR